MPAHDLESEGTQHDSPAANSTRAGSLSRYDIEPINLQEELSAGDSGRHPQYNKKGRLLRRLRGIRNDNNENGIGCCTIFLSMFLVIGGLTLFIWGTIWEFKSDESHGVDMMVFGAIMLLPGFYGVALVCYKLWQQHKTEQRSRRMRRSSAGSNSSITETENINDHGNPTVGDSHDNSGSRPAIVGAMSIISGSRGNTFRTNRDGASLLSSEEF